MNFVTSIFWSTIPKVARHRFGVLVDISGSMLGQSFRSVPPRWLCCWANYSHKRLRLRCSRVISRNQGFADEQSLDEVADRLLELKATGGTCVDAALRWVYDQFDADFESDRQILFLLSDYCFFEKPESCGAGSTTCRSTRPLSWSSPRSGTHEASTISRNHGRRKRNDRLKRFEDLPTILNQRSVPSASDVMPGVNIFALCFQHISLTGSLVAAATTVPSSEIAMQSRQRHLMFVGQHHFIILSAG